MDGPFEKQGVVGSHELSARTAASLPAQGGDAGEALVVTKLHVRNFGQLMRHFVGMYEARLPNGSSSQGPHLFGWVQETTVAVGVDVRGSGAVGWVQVRERSEGEISTAFHGLTGNGTPVAVITTRVAPSSHGPLEDAVSVVGQLQNHVPSPVLFREGRRSTQSFRILVVIRVKHAPLEGAAGEGRHPGGDSYFHGLRQDVPRELGKKSVAVESLLVLGAAIEDHEAIGVRLLATEVAGNVSLLDAACLLELHF